MNESNATIRTEAQLLPLAEAGNMNAALELAKLYLENHNPALLKWANTLCAGGMPEGYYLLGKCYQFGIAVESDLAEAERLYRKSAEMEFPRALRSIASLLIADPKKRSANMREAIRLLKQAVAEGDEKAMYALALLYQKGEGVARSGRKEFELLCSSAELDYAPAMTALGEIYLQHPESHDNGIEWLQKAVALGDGNAQRILDRLSESDTRDDNASPDDTKDSPEFLEFMEELKNSAAESFQRKDQMIADAEVGDPDAQYLLGVAYYEGRTADGLPFDQNADTGHQWLQKAARQGHDMACAALGMIAERQDDYETAIEWYIPAATNGLVEAVTNLGVAYGMTGQDDKAVHWFKKGVDMGDAVAMSRLATHYVEGRGVSVNMDEAIRLYKASVVADDLYGCSCLASICLRPEHLDVSAAESALIKLANAGLAQYQTVLARIYMGVYGEELVDYTIAEDLLESAAKQGDNEAVYLLGIFYYYIDRNKGWAYDALSHAASRGSQEAQTALRDLFGAD